MGFLSAFQKESSVPIISAATRMPHPKGAATAFSLDVVRQKTLTGELSAVIRIAVAIRKKLQFFYWKKDKFLELHPEVSIPYEPRSISWCKDSVCVAFVGGYTLVKLNRASQSDGGICELFSAGVKDVKQNSSVTLLADERFALLEDKSTKFIDLVIWSTLVQQLQSRHFEVIGSVLVHSKMIQQLPM